MPKNLWGDLTNLEIVRTPKSILQEQADVLTKATEGELIGEVEEAGVLQGDLQYEFDVRVPSLNNYVYTILTISHGIELYPLLVVSTKPQRSVPCSDQSAFEQVIASILSSPEVKLVLSRLVSQVK